MDHHGHSGRTAAVLSIALAVVFFCAGYFLRTTQTARAASGTIVRDGNPVGHELAPKVSAPPTLMQCLKILAGHPIAIRYHTAQPGQPPHLGHLKCKDGSRCVEFNWANMDLYTVGPGPSYMPAHHETVDVYGTFSLI